jgi:hypothetical protein
VISSLTTTPQYNTHIKDLREICYPWHPWHGRKVWVHATLVKRGWAVAHCSLEEAQPLRVLEIPLWMLDVAACCKIRMSKSGLASIESLRELKAQLDSGHPASGDGVRENQHHYLLHTGGADVSVAGSGEIQSTAPVCSAAQQPALGRSFVRCSTEDSAIVDATTAAASGQIHRHGNGRGGER